MTEKQLRNTLEASTWLSHKGATLSGRKLQCASQKATAAAAAARRTPPPHHRACGCSKTAARRTLAHSYSPGCQDLMPFLL